MTMRVHIERLVLYRNALSSEQLPRFRAALAVALERLHSPNSEPAPGQRDAVTRLAERTATAIHRHVVRR